MTSQVDAIAQAPARFERRVSERISWLVSVSLTLNSASIGELLVHAGLGAWRRIRVAHGEETPPEPAAFAVHHFHAFDEGPALGDVDERRRQKRIVDDAADRTAAEQERLPRGNVGFELARALEPALQLEPRSLVTA